VSRRRIRGGSRTAASGRIAPRRTSPGADGWALLSLAERRNHVPTEQPPENPEQQENPPEALPGPSAAASACAYVSSSWQSLRRKAYRRWPSVFPDPDLRCHLAAWADRDPQENCRTAPTAGEAIEVHALWVVEAYPPSYINDLLSALKVLGWDNADSSLPDHNPVLWLRQIRQRSTSSAWLNLGPVVRPGSKRFLPSERIAPLPEGIDYAFAQIHNVTSSITCIVVAFVFTAVTGCVKM